MLKKILIALVGIVAILLITAAVLPKDFSVEREIVINKPREAVFADLRIIKNHEAWNPWMKRDPNVKSEYLNDTGQVGAKHSWTGNSEVGVGEEEITKIVENERVDIDLRFKAPLEGKDEAYLITEVVGEGQTKVKWGFSGHTKFPFNLMCKLMHTQMIKDFDQGLADLKAHLEK